MNGSQRVASGAATGVELVGEDGTVYRSSWDPMTQVSLEENGPVRAVVVARGTHRSMTGGANMQFTVRLHFYRGHSRVRVFCTLRNASESQQENVAF